jgi:hypothetical protein
LITYVDDYGRGSADPEILKGFVFPRRRSVTEAQIEKALSDLANTGMITLYEVGGESFFYFPSWGDHQRIQTKKSKFPEPAESTVVHRDAPPESNTNPNTNPNPNPNTKVRPRGEYGWVKLSDAQYDKLCSDLGKAEADRCIAYVDESAQGTNNKNKWSDWNLVVRKCHRDGWGKKREQMTNSNPFAEMLMEAGI